MNQMRLLTIAGACVMPLFVPVRESAAQNALGGGMAQDALGSGNALDRNLSTTGGRINSPSPIEDFRLRNQIITGNVAGGRGFRGSVGYSAENDFRAAIGSNDLFRFRADSMYSDPIIFGNRRTFEQLRFGQSLAGIEVERSGTGASGSTIRHSSFESQSAVYNARLRLDRATNYASTTVAMETSAEPTLVGAMVDKDGRPVFIRSSPLRGLSGTPFNAMGEVIGLTSYDEARDRQDRESGKDLPLVGSPFETRFQDQAIDERIAPEPAAARINPDANADYRAVLDGIIARYSRQQNLDPKDSPEVAKSLEEQLNQLRTYLHGDHPRDRKDAKNAKSDTPDDPLGLMPREVPKKPTVKPAKAAQEPGEAPGRIPGDAITPPDSEVTAGMVPAPAPTVSPNPLIGNEPAHLQIGEQPEVKPLDPASFSPMLKHGIKMPTLTKTEQSRFDELMSTAEKRLHDGDYFWAERRFERALRFAPGHPLASIGIAHSQLGAGLYLSASLSLRTTFMQHPEMIDVTYGEQALPPREHLLKIAKTIRTYADDPQMDRTGYAFVLAYLGHQLEDRSLMEKGLKIIEDLDADSTLLPLLKGVWLAPADAASATPQPVPASQPEK